MVVEAVKQFNYLDIIILIILFRICYIAVKSGIVAESFKLLGVISAIYIASHYYTLLSDVILKGYMSKIMPLEFADFIVYILLAGAAYFLFILLRSTFCRFIKTEAAPNFNKYGGIVVGLIRAYFTVGLVIYVLMISSVSYISGSVKHSYLGSKFSSVAPNTYGWLWGAVFSKFSPQEKINPVVNEVKESFNK